MNKLTFSFLLLTLGFLSTACSERWREVDSGLNGQEVYDKVLDLTELQSLQTEGELIDVDEFEEILDGGRLYYAGYPSGLSPVIEGIFPVYFPEFFSEQTQPNLEEIEEVHAYFAAKRVSSGSIDAILIIEYYDVRTPESAQVKVYKAEEYGSITPDGFEIELQSGELSIRLVSNDPVSEDEMADNIQLKVYDDAGDLRGQISSLEGFELIL